MNEEQRKKLIAALEKLMAQVEDDDEFDAIDDVRYAVKTWDLQGAIPYESELRAWGIDLDTILSASETGTATSDETTVLGDEEVKTILAGLRRCIQQGDARQSKICRDVRREVRAWDKSGRHGPLPRAEELAELGIWPPSAEAEPSTEAEPLAEEEPPSQLEDVIPDSMRIEYQTARELMDVQPYQAIKRLEALYIQAEGRLRERIADDLDQARAALQRRTKALILGARRVRQEHPRDLEAQAQAWRAVTALNPESLEAQEALQQLQLRRRQAIEAEIEDIVQQAQSASDRDHLPDLNEARSRITVLVNRPELPEDLRERAQEVQEQVLELLAKTRDRLGVASTLMVEGDLRAAYLDAREKSERVVPVMIDAGGWLGEAGREIDTHIFFSEVSKRFLAATQEKVAERLQMAQGARRSDPRKALQWLQEARSWLTDDVWTLDHRKELRSLLREVENEIERVNRLLADFEQAGELVIEARKTGVEARRRLELLNQAQQRYPDYPNIRDYIEEARDNLAGELAGEVETEIVKARRLVAEEKFSEAMEVLEQARKSALRDVPKPKPDSELAEALEHLKEEKNRVLEAERALRDLEALLEQVEKKLDAYDESKSEALLDEARALLDQVPEDKRQHLLTKQIRSRLIARQGDVENYNAGLRAYQNGEWESAIDYFGKVKRSSQRYDEAQSLLRRAQAALAAQAAQQAEQASEWDAALEHYERALYLFQTAGEDALTQRIAAKCRERRDRIAENKEKVLVPLQEAERLLEQAENSVLPPNSSLSDRLDPIIEFQEVIQKLEPLASKPSTLSGKIRTVLRQAREAWRKAYLPVLREVAAKGAGRNLLAKAWQRAKELWQAGLLYSQEEERLYYQLLGKQLDQEYADLRRAPTPDWRRIEENRRERMELPVVEKPPNVEQEWEEARRKRVKAEIREARKAGPETAKQLLEKIIHEEKLHDDRELLIEWLKLCWETLDWEEAEHVVRLLGDTEYDQPRSYRAMWQYLTYAARAYAENNVAEGRGYIEAARQAMSDPVIEDIEVELEEPAMERALNAAREIRRQIDRSTQVAPEQYLKVIRAYAVVLDISPEHPVAERGVRDMREKVVPLLEQRAQEAAELRLSQDDLDAALRKTGRLLRDLKTFSAIEPYLKLPPESSDILHDGMERAQKKQSLWEYAREQLEKFEEAIEVALTSPVRSQGGGSRSSGWDFSEARQVISDLRNRAIKERDRELQALVTRKLTRLEHYEEVNQRIKAKVQQLLKAIETEQFKQVIEVAQELEAQWQEARSHNSKWDGLAKVIYHHYRSPNGSQVVDTLPEYQKHARKQQANLKMWERYKKEVDDQYSKLKEMFREELSDGDLAVLRLQPLAEVQEKCEEWERQRVAFLQKLAQRPQDPPLSKRADEVRRQIRDEERRQNVEEMQARVEALKAEIQRREEEFQECIKRFRQFYNGIPYKVKRGRRKLLDHQVKFAKRMYQECRKSDPKNSELARLRKQFERIGVEFDE